MLAESFASKRLAGRGNVTAVRHHWRVVKLSGPLLRPASSRTLRSARPDSTGVATSPNWSGYVDTGHSVAFRFAAANFTAPSVNCNASPLGSQGSEAGVAVSLDGWNAGDNNLEAIGYQQGCDSSGPYPVVWYEACLPTCTENAYTGAVNPGDALNASVYYLSSAHEYQFVLTDLTQGINVISTSVSGSAPNSSAELMTYAPGAGPASGVYLSDIGAVGYTNATVTSRDGVRGNLGSNSLWNSTNVTMTNRTTGHTVAKAGPLQGGSAYLSTWTAPF